VGSVTGRQRSSRDPLYIGHRRISNEYNFAGAIDEVRIYSTALMQDGVTVDMAGAAAPGNLSGFEKPTAGAIDASRQTDTAARCSGTSESEDARLPGAVAVFGVLVAFATAGLWPSGRPILFAVASLVAGLFLVPAVSPTLPSLTRWMMPLVSFAGGIAVVVSLRRSDT